jgi:CHAT domain-containing protein
LFRPESTRATELSQIQLTATKRQFVDKLLDRGSESSQAGDFQVALFESLIPNRIKGPLLQSSRLCVVVDENTAAYPWELLSEPSHDPTVPNFAVKSSLIRRFSTSTFRAAAIEKAKTLTALIVGDPSLTSHASLPGANYEALAISKLLGQHHGVERVRILTGTDSGAASVEIINALFAERYGIVHVAARGGFEHGRPGLLIGDNTWLTPGEFEQMPVLPNLVFINFGHLGRIDEPGLGWLGPLAAAYAAGLIRTGVPAVVVSGWVVDGAASITFGTQLYSAMLAGEPFAAAVRRARTQTYESHPGVNTWGAFQCYGSPDFSLIDSFAKERLVPDK